jgi:hypothetical protein
MGKTNGRLVLAPSDATAMRGLALGSAPVLRADITREYRVGGRSGQPRAGPPR